MTNDLPLSSLEEALIDGRRASMVTHRSPLERNTDVRAVVAGVALRDLAPVTDQPLVLRLNGEFILREHWWRPTFPGDVVEWHILPQGGGNGISRLILTVAVIALSIYGGPAVGAALGAGTGAAGAAIGAAFINLAGGLLINALVPVQQPQLGGNVVSPGSVYNVAVAGNQARLNQPIPEIFGRCLTFPDFASKPYSEFIGNDQYYHVILCVGQGSYVPERLQIDDTALKSFQDVLTARWLEPGELPQDVLANVVTAPEVVGQDLLSGVYVGAFAACSPKFSAAAIGIDIVLPRGLGLADSSGDIGSLSAKFRVDGQYIDDFGVPTSAWFALGPTETITDSTSTPVRRSFKYTLATSGRLQIRVGRQDVRNANVRALHDMSWAGLRAYLDAEAPLEPTATHVEVRIRASEQLSGFSQSKISAVVRRKLPTWSSGSGWSAPVETRSAAWALAYLWKSDNGEGQSDATIDLLGLERLAATNAARQDRFDMIFDGKVTTRDAARTIAQSCRAMPFSRMTVSTVSRDELQTLPVTAFLSRHMIPGSMSIGYSLPTDVIADGVIIEYFDNRSWDWREITCPAPGVVTPTNAVRFRISGVTGAKHAEREGLYMAAANLYRRKFPKFQTEMLGMLPAFGSLAIFAPALPGWGQSGDVAFWDADTRVMGLSEPVAFTPGAQHYISLQRDDGSVTDAIAVEPGPTANDVVLASVPDFVLVLDDAFRERPKYIFGADGQHRIMVRVLGITKRGKNSNGAPSIEIASVGENVLVHGVDAHLLPSPGEVQDPVDSANIPVDDGGSGSGSFAIIALTGHELEDGSFVSGGGSYLSFTLANDGTASWYGATMGTTVIPEEWSGVPIDLTIAAGFEVYATPLYGYGAQVGGAAQGTWLNLATSRTWVMDISDVAHPVGDRLPTYLQLQIREVGSTVPQATAVIKMQIDITNQGP